MQNASNTYIESQPVPPGFKIKSSEGFVPLKSVNVTAPTRSLRITTRRGAELICSGNHRLFTPDGKTVFAAESLGADIATLDGTDKVVSIDDAGTRTLYDVTVGSERHEYAVNGIQSHNCVCIDEAAFIDDAEDVFQSIAPTLTRDKEAELLVTSTPGGMSGWFWELYCNAGDDWYVQTTTIHDAVQDGLDVDVEELRRLCPDPDVFAQEYECRFSKESAAMLDPDLLQFADEIPEKANLDFLGYDVGSTNDRSVLTDLRTADNDVYWVDAPVVMSRTSYEDQLQALAALQEKRRFRKGYVDSNGIGSAVAEFARKKVSALIEPWHWTAQNKTQAYEALRDLVFRRKIFFPRSAERLIRDDFRNVRRVVGQSGAVSYVAGRNGDGHSDFVSSLVLAVMAALKHPAGHQTIRPAPYGGRFKPTRLF